MEVFHVNVVDGRWKFSCCCVNSMRWTMEVFMLCVNVP